MQPVDGVALEAPPEHAAYLVRSVGRQFRPVNLVAQDRRHRVRDGLSLEQPTAGQHLVEHDAERPDIRALVDRLAARLLGGHVGRAAENDAELGAGTRERWRVHRILARADATAAGVGGPASARASKRVERLRQTEIEQLDGAAGCELDVGGLQIPMNDPALVGRLESGGDLMRDGQRLLERNGAGRDPIRERRAIDELHHERTHGRLPGGPGRKVLEPVDLRDVRVVQGREQLCLSIESHEAFDVAREQLRQDLHGDVAIEPRVARAVHFPHTACAEQELNLVHAEAGAGREGHRIEWSKDSEKPGTVHAIRLHSSAFARQAHGPPVTA